MSATPTLKADARNRSWRTALQGLVASVAVAVLTVAEKAVADGVDKIDASTLQVSLETAAATAVLSWLHRRFLDTSPVPSIEPPSDKVEPQQPGTPGAGIPPTA